MLVIDTGFYPIYEIEKDMQLVFASETTPQLVTVHEDRFIVPMFPYEGKETKYEPKCKELLNKMLKHISGRVQCARSVNEAKIVLASWDLPFGEIITLSDELRFAVSEPEFLGVFVELKIPTWIGAFAQTRSIVRIIDNAEMIE
jgi:hypothetical protein